MQFVVIAIIAFVLIACVQADLDPRIAQATRNYWGHSTTDGPGGGVEACAWAVNNIMTNAGIAKIGSNTNYVPSVVDALRGGRGRAISPGEAQPGDLAVACNQAHIGVCMSSGCGVIDSNSSSQRCFCWQATYAYFTQYFGCAPQLFRVEN